LAPLSHHAEGGRLEHTPVRVAPSLPVAAIAPTPTDSRRIIIAV
jgi:hypothetical protein